MPLEVGSNPTSVALRERVLAAKLARMQSETAEKARRFVLFACRCLRETPISPGLTPIVLLNEETVLNAAVKLANRWASGETVSLHELEDTDAALVQPAAAIAKNGLTYVSGRPAAFMAAVSVVKAATEAVRGRFDEVAGESVLAASFARKAGANPTHEAIDFQDGLAVSILANQ